MALSLAPRVFGRIEIRPGQRQLLVDGAPVTVGSRAYDVLWALADLPGRVVTKHELLDIAWGGLDVEENNLAVQISALRRLLGPGWIATVPGRGYRFVAPDEPARVPVPVAGASFARASVLAPSTRMSRGDAPLYGRATELAQLSAAIGDSRLVTLTGIGGIGKSHLAQRLLGERARLGSADVAWAELAPLAGPEFVVATVANACGAMSSEPDPLAGLVAALGQRELLLGIDNAEHLSDEVVRVVQALLDGAPRVRVLVTSQTPLRLARERAVRLAPLACAPADAAPAQALQYGAVELFVRRAQAADTRFQLRADNVARVVDICSRVGGLPLAIELAAARTPLLRLAGLTALLSDPLRLLAAGQRSLDERHRALRTTLAWSHGLLAEREKAAFRRLGVFAGGCSLEMARDVVMDAAGETDAPAGGPRLLEDDVAALDAIGELVDRSLVEIDDSEPPRYRLIETTRAYAIEQLEAAGETRAWQARHARVVTAHAAAVDGLLSAGLRTRDETVAALWLDIDNLRAAFAWTLEQSPALALRLAPVIGGLFRNILFAEVREMWEATLPFVDDHLPAPVRARWADGYAYFWANRDLRRNLHWAGVAVALYAALDDAPGLLRALYLLASAKARAGLDGQPELARIRAIDTTGMPVALRFTQVFAEAVMATFGGEFDAAIAFYAQARRLSAVMGDIERHFSVSSNLIDVEMARGRLADAVRHGEELVAELRTGHLGEYLTVALLNLAAGLIAQGALARAREVAAEGLPRAFDHALGAEWSDHLACLAAQEGRARDAAWLLGYGDVRYEERGSSRTTNEAAAAERAEALARAGLGDTSFAVDRTHGRGLTERQLVEVALGR